MTASTSAPADSHTALLRDRLSAEASVAQTAAMCAAAALLSVLYTGAVFGVDNHVFHLPIIQRLYDEAAFRNDAFIQSLRHYASGVWLLLAGGAKYAGDGSLLFLVLLYLSRLLSFVGFVACASLIGVRSVGARVIFCLVLCFISFMDGTSFAGDGGLFIRSFSHSEIAVGTILLAIYFAARAQIAPALVCAGATFFVNAFMGVWLVAPLAAIAGALLLRRAITFRRLLSEGLVGGLGGLVLAAPVIYNVISNPDLGRKLGFSYPAYLRDYFGAHFFIDASPASEWMLLAALTVLGWVVFTRLGGQAREYRAALIGMTALYGIGIIASLVSESALILNLHLLRSGLMIHGLVAMGAAALATHWLTSRDRCEATMLGPCLLFSLCVRSLFPAAILLVALAEPIRAWVKDGRYDKLRAAIFAALALVVLPSEAWLHVRANSLLTATGREWEGIGRWARASTPAGSIFLFGISGAGAEAGPADADRTAALVESAAVFEAAAHRRIWVDFKRGAAVMWQPSYYDEWRARINSVAALKTLAQKIDYARANGIGYVIDDCRAFTTVGIDPDFRTDHLCVTTVRGAPG